MKSVWYCALTVLTLAAWTTLSWAGDGCCNGGCGQKSIQAASCCDDCCEKPSLCDRLKARFKKNDCCDTCDSCGNGHVTAMPVAPAAPAPEQIPAPMPK